MGKQIKKKLPLWIPIASTLVTIILNPTILTAFAHGFISLAVVEFLGGFLFCFAVLYMVYCVFAKTKS